MGLVKSIDSKLKDSKTKFHKQPPNYTTSSYTQPQITQKIAATTIPGLTNPSTTTIVSGNDSINRFSIRRITVAQREERKAKGICFNCDEKFIPGHRCAAGKFLLLMIDDDTTINNEEITEIVDEEPNAEETYFQLSP